MIVQVLYCTLTRPNTNIAKDKRKEKGRKM